MMKDALDMLCSVDRYNWKLLMEEARSGRPSGTASQERSLEGTRSRFEDIKKWSVRNNSSRNRAERADGTGCC